MRIEVCGHSDDLLCCSGDIKDEWSAYFRRYLHFSNGTVLEAEYDPSDEEYMWRIRPVKVADGVTIERQDGTYADEGPCDRLVITGKNLKVTGCWDTPHGPSDEEATDFLHDFNWSGAGLALKKSVMELIAERHL